MNVLYIHDDAKDIELLSGNDNHNIEFHKFNVESIKEKNFNFDGFGCIVVKAPLKDNDCADMVRFLKGKLHCPVIVYGKCDDVEKLFEAGADDYVGFECDPRNRLLLNKIMAQVERSRGDELHRLIYDNTPDFLVIIDENGVVLEISRSLPLGLGYALDEIIESSITKFVTEEPTHVHKLLDEVVENGRGLVTLTCFTKTGRLVPVEINSKVVQYHGKRAILCFLRDVSTRIAMERKLKEGEIEVETLINSVQAEAFLLDSEGKIVAGNDRFAANIGKRREEFLGKKVWEVAQGFALAMKQFQGERAISTGEPTVFEEVVNGVVMENRVYPIKDTEGRVRRLAILSIDVSERTLWEKRLEYMVKSADMIRKAEDLEEIYDAVMWILSDGFRYELVGIGVAEVDRLRIVRQSGGEHRMEFIPLDAKSVMVRALKTSTTQFVTDSSLDPGYLLAEWQEEPHGSEIAVPVLVDGKPELVINIEHKTKKAFNDSDRRIVELLASDVGHAMELLRSRERLREMERTRMKDVLDSAKRTIWMVSKDMNAPLRAVEEASYLLRQDPSKAEVVADLIDRDIRRALDVLLNITSITAPDQLHKRIVDLNEIVEYVLGTFQMPENVKVETFYETEFTARSVDPELVRRVICNLIENALDFMPNGGVLRVGVKTVVGVVELSISDTGVGMIPSVAENLFKPFFSTKSDGFGLGLAFCKQAVELHGGSISVESAPGKGTTFTIRLP
jgi:PAS domain S-box-containing protein